MPNIRITNANKARLESLGRFGDSHDSVLSRALDLIMSDRRLAEKVRTNPHDKASPEGDHAGMHRRARKGTVTNERFFIPYILSTLKNAKDHAMHCGDVLAELETIVSPDKLSPLDFDVLPSGVVRWKNKAQWARKIMVDEELLETVEKAGHGVWKLTEAGLSQARKG